MVYADYELGNGILYGILSGRVLVRNTKGGTVCKFVHPKVIICLFPVNTSESGGHTGPGLRGRPGVELGAVETCKDLQKLLSRPINERQLAALPFWYSKNN